VGWFTGFHQRFSIGQLVWEGLHRVFPTNQTKALDFTSVVPIHTSFAAADPLDCLFVQSLLHGTPVDQAFLRMKDLLEVINELASNLADLEEHPVLQSIDQASLINVRLQSLLSANL